MKPIDPTNFIIDVVMFDGDSNVQLAGDKMKVHYPKFTAMCGVEHTVSLLFNYVLNIPF